MRIIYTLTIAMFFIIPNYVISAELPFLFSVDQNISSEEPKDIITPGKDISNNEWFVSPPTRIELITYIMDQWFKKEMENEPSSDEIYEYFEKGKVSFSVDKRVSFSKEFDAFVAGITVDYVGRPKKPMKNFCDGYIKYLSSKLGGEGYLYHNTFLRTFIAGSFDDPEIINIVKLLRNNIYVVVGVNSIYEGKDKSSENFYDFRAIKNIKEDKVHYIKNSYSIGQ